MKDTVFDSDANLAAAIREVLDTVSEGQTLFGRISQGGLGTKAYRRARFLKIGSDTFVINWARTFIKEYYPATLSKRGDLYSLVHDKRTSLIIESFKCWLSQRVEGELPELKTAFEQLEPQVELKEQVRKRRESGALLETIAAEFDISIYNASQWCKDVKVEKGTVRGKAAKKRAEKNRLKHQASEMEKLGMKRAEIAHKLGVNRKTITRWLS